MGLKEVNMIVWNGYGGRYILQHKGIDGIIILKWILKKIG
jgi:hypothetical protein